MPTQKNQTSSNHSFQTPMMLQYMEIKENYPHCLLFYRMGDFYELFLEDAVVGSKVLGITLTQRSKGNDGEVPMAGVPYHAVEPYLHKLVESGHRVAICEQLTEPDGKGIVERGVVRVVSPGSELADEATAHQTSPQLVCIVKHAGRYCIVVTDITSGELQLDEVSKTDLHQELKKVLTQWNVTECILPEKLYNDQTLLYTLSRKKSLSIYSLPKRILPSLAVSKKRVQAQFKTKQLASIGKNISPVQILAIGTTLAYLQDELKLHLTHITKLQPLYADSFVMIDAATQQNLELFQPLHPEYPEASFYHFFNQTLSHAGNRLLLQWLRKPLNSKKEIQSRQAAVDTLLKSDRTLQQLRTKLEQLPDLERIIARIATNLSRPPEIQSLAAAIGVLETLETIVTPLDNLQLKIPPKIRQLKNDIQAMLLDELPNSAKDENLIRAGFDTKIDKLTTEMQKSLDWIESLEKTTQQQTGISTLKVGYNKVFGYYIEISKASAKHAPREFERKQTLVNAERFTTPQLKQHEYVILEKQTAIAERSQDLYHELLKNIRQAIPQLQTVTHQVATLDCYTSLATVSRYPGYTKPSLASQAETKITQGRHPVIERLNLEHDFVPNDTLLSNSSRFQLITGPNMAGKSVYMRQVALISLMAHLGSYVPADSATIGMVDSIFVRSGASDNIAAGQSTFMIEMSETAYILRNATEKSLIILDEIGRGTSTYDGISIAWALAEYICTHFKHPPRTLFATHYHELQELEDYFTDVLQNVHLMVDDSGSTTRFLYTLAAGPASDSFGIEVAEQAGLPREVIQKSHQLLQSFREQTVSPHGVPSKTKASTPLAIESELLKKLKSVTIETTTPLDALTTLAALKKLAETERDNVKD